VQAAYAGLVERHSNGQLDWTGEIRFLEERLAQPLRWKQPKRIFVNSMSDLFHESVPDEWIDQIFAVMALTPQHTYQCLTKRPERMYQYIQHLIAGQRFVSKYALRHDMVLEKVMDGPLSNLWLGVSTENQATADERIPWLLKTPAAGRFVSYEPALGPVDFCHVAYPGVSWKVDVLRGGAWDIPQWHPGFTNHSEMGMVDWVIIGGENGPQARGFDIEWAYKVIEQCVAAHVPVWMKQFGARPYEVSEFDKTYPLRFQHRAGADIAEWPAWAQVQQFPVVTP
jgi:protein gp37